MRRKHRQGSFGKRKPKNIFLGPGRGLAYRRLRYLDLSMSVLRLQGIGGDILIFRRFDSSLV